MIKEAGKVVLISSDRNLNQALFAQFKLVDFLDVEFFSVVGDYENNNHPDLIIYNNEVKKLQLLDIKNHIKTNKPFCPRIILNDYLDYSVKLKLALAFPSVLSPITQL